MVFNRNLHISQKSREKYESIGEIGELPPVADPDRRRKCEADFALWRATYCAPRHLYADSKNHAVMCQRLQDCIESADGWLTIMAPRGEAKSTTVIEACAWAIYSGRKRCVGCLSSSTKTARNNVGSFSAILTKLPLIQADYPEVWVPVREKIEKTKQRQVYHLGKKVSLTWEGYDNGTHVFRLPDIEGSPSRFSHFYSQSINSKMRGMMYAAPDGSIVRPDLLLADDIQDPAISKNPDRVRDALNKMTVDGAGMRGNDPMPLINLGTPFHTDCLMAQAVRDKRFAALVLKAIYEFPTRMDLWEKYSHTFDIAYDEAAARHGKFRNDLAYAEALAAASQFYVQNREAMDAGMEMAWEAKYSDKKAHSGASPIENIMREYYFVLTPAVFDQEKNCDLKSLADGSIELITQEIFDAKITETLPEFVSPNTATLITYSIDIHENVLYYEGVAWSEGFDGHVITYGTFPEQSGSAWTQRTCKQTLGRRYHGRGKQGSIYAGIEELVETIFKRKYLRADGTEIFVETVLIDNNNGLFKPTVEKVVEESPHRKNIILYIGQWYGAGTQSRTAKDRGGIEWKYGYQGSLRNNTIIAFRDWWKSYNHDRWLVARGDSGCKTIFNGSARRHRKFYDELTCQKPHWVSLPSGEAFRRWQNKSIDNEGLDDHWGDCDFMNTVAASVKGIRQKSERSATPARKSVSLKGLNVAAPLPVVARR